jgi:hypothetical protein
MFKTRPVSAVLNVRLRSYEDFMRWANRTFHLYYNLSEYRIFAMRRPKEPELVSDADPFDEPLAVFFQPYTRLDVFAEGFELKSLPDSAP